LCFLEAATLVAARESILQTKTSGATDEEVTSMLDAFEAYADTANFYPPNRKLICSVSGNEVPVYKSLSGSYWRDHCLHQCGKGDLDKTLAAVGEVESHFVLAITPTSTDCDIPSGKLASGATVLRSACTSQCAHNGLLGDAAALYSGGVQVNLKNIFDSQKRSKVNLPVYPLKKERYWITEISQHSPAEQPKTESGQ